MSNAEQDQNIEFYDTKTGVIMSREEMLHFESYGRLYGDIPIAKPKSVVAHNKYGIAYADRDPAQLVTDIRNRLIEDKAEMIEYELKSDPKYTKPQRKLIAAARARLDIYEKERKIRKEMRDGGVLKGFLYSLIVIVAFFAGIFVGIGYV